MLAGISICLILMVGRFYVTGHIAGGDAVYYYINLRSLVMDQDFSFANEYQHFYQQISPFTGNRKVASIPEPNPITGRLPNKYPLGSAILLIPFFVVGHILTFMLNGLGASLALDGYSTIYQLSAALGNLFYGLLGLIIIYRLGRKIYAENLALAGVVTICGATPLIYYLTMEPMMSHGMSAFAVAAFISYWHGTRPRRSMLQWFILGLIGGVMGVIRYQDATFLLIPVADWVILRFQPGTGRSWSRGVLELITCAAGALLISCLQFYVNDCLYGSPFATGYAGEDFLHWKSPRLLATLFGAQSGLLLWSPAICFALIGLLGFRRKFPVEGALLGLAFVLQWYLVSSWSAPTQGDSFGNRMLLNCAVIFGLGLMAFLDRIRRRTSLYSAALVLFAGFIGLNGILAGFYCFRIIGNPY